jgi:hypothetical protein
MKITFKDAKKVLLGLLIMFSVYNAYFAISGNMPPAHPGSPVAFTPGIAGTAAVVGFLFSLIVFYLFYLRKVSEKLTSKDVAKMLVGAFVFGVASHLVDRQFGLAGIYFVLFCVCLYLGFLKDK